MQDAALHPGSNIKSPVCFQCYRNAFIMQVFWEVVANMWPTRSLSLSRLQMLPLDSVNLSTARQWHQKAKRKWKQSTIAANCADKHQYKGCTK